MAVRKLKQKNGETLWTLPYPSGEDTVNDPLWAIVSAHQAGLSIRRIAGATGLSSSRIHQLLNASEAKGIPVWLSQLRRSSGGYAPKKEAERPEPETKSDSACREKLRRCDAALIGCSD
jgi:hypothetical protein